MLTKYPFNLPYRVAVVGIGAMTPIGNNVQEFWQGLMEGRCGIEQLTFLKKKVRCQVGGEVKGVDKDIIIRNLGLDPSSTQAKAVKRAERAGILALGAVQEAITQAKFPDELRRETGLLIGSNTAGMGLIAEATQAYEVNPRRVSSQLSTKGMPNATVGTISIVDKFQGGGFSPASACATGAHGIGTGFILVGVGLVPVIIAGGAESSFAGPLIASFSNLHALTERNNDPHKSSRPFDADRDGFAPSEGAGVLVLMIADLAKELGIEILAEVVGYGMSFDANHITEPTVDGMALAMRRALEVANVTAGIEIEDVNCVNAHATSTPRGDGVELEAIDQVLGDHAHNVFVSSNKGHVGHEMGAAGGVESVAAVKTIQTGRVPPTLNLERPDSKVCVRHVIGSPITTDVRVVLKNSFGFGGTNACLVFRRWEDGE